MPSSMSKSILVKPYAEVQVQTKVGWKLKWKSIPKFNGNQTES